MKCQTLIALLSLALFPFLLSGQSAISSDSTGLPGDHFSLEGALEIFKASNSLEDFEKRLNTEDNYVNNLDLNEDGEIDFIRVIDNMEGDVHAIVLQAPLSENESQDIAVIEIEKDGAESAMLQIIGDEAIYGEALIVEPYEMEGSGGKGGPAAEMNLTRVVVNVWGWKPVRFIYRPNYAVYASPWRWRLYPKWWKPWRPRSYRVFHPLRVRHHVNYRVTTTHRVVRAHRVYTPKRRSSAVVVSKTTVRRNAVRRPGSVKKTTVVAKKGRKGAVVGRKTTRTTRIKRNKRN